MASLACDLPAKLLKALALGLIRDSFYDDLDITRSELITEVFSSSVSSSSSSDSKSSDDGLEFSQTLSSFFRDCAATNAGVADVSAQLQKQGMSAELAEVCGKVWKTEASRVHDTLVQKSVWGKQFSGCAWRVDVKQQQKRQQTTAPASTTAEEGAEGKAAAQQDAADDEDRLSAILQMKFKSSVEKEVGENSFHFEVTPAKARALLKTVEDIEAHLNAPMSN
jgi:hypothetical protein